MSGDDDPSGTPPERTVVRPNPGLRKPPSPPQPAGPREDPLAPPHYTPATAPAYQPREQPPQPASSPYGLPPSRQSDEFGATAPGVEDWIQSRRPRDPNAPLQRAEDLHFEDLAAQNENPIMRAAGPLLLLLGRLRVAVLRASFASLMEQVAAAVNFFDCDIRSAGIPPEQANVAKYAICAMADDIVQNIPTEDRHVWTQYSMLSRFFGERIGGVRFFQELDRLKREPAVNYNVLELFHSCLALGFQGVHRTSVGGAGQLQAIQRDLYETLRRVRRRTTLPLAPRWRGQEMPLKHSKLRVPLWAVAGILAFALLDLFLFLRTTLSHHADLAAQAMIELHPARKVVLERRGPVVAPPPSTQVKNIVDAFKDDHDIFVNASGNWIIINVGAGILFEVGQSHGIAAVPSDCAKDRSDRGDHTGPGEDRRTYRQSAARPAQSVQEQSGAFGGARQSGLRHSLVNAEQFEPGHRGRQGAGQSSRQKRDVGRKSEKPSRRGVRHARELTDAEDDDGDIM